MNILIVGGAGYVGGALTDELAGKANVDFTVLDNLTYEESYRKEVHFVRGDVRDKFLMKTLLRNADVVVWLAAIVGDGACAVNPDVARDINTESVKWLVKNFNRRIVFTSTCSVYGSQEGLLFEDSPVNPLSVYAYSKLEAEKALSGTEALIFRLGTLYGVGDRFSRIRLDLVINTLTFKAFKEHKLSIFGGEQWRPVLHVSDAALAISKLMGAKVSGVYNLKEVNVTVNQVADAVKAQFKDVEVVKTEMLFEDARNYRVSSAKVEEDTGFLPRKVIYDGVKELKELLEEGRVRDYYSPRYLNDMFLRFQRRFE